MDASLSSSATCVLVVRAGSSDYGVPMDRVLEISVNLQPSIVPGAPTVAPAVVPYNERAVPLVDLPYLSNGEHSALDRNVCVVFTRGAADQALGLLIDSFHGLVEVSDVPSWSERAGADVCKKELLILDVGKLLVPTDRSGGYR